LPQPAPDQQKSGMQKNLSAPGNHLRTCHVVPVTEAPSRPSPTKENPMLSWAVTFLIIAIIAGVLGFGGIAGTSAGIAQVLFFVFLVLFVLSLVRGAIRR